MFNHDGIQITPHNLGRVKYMSQNVKSRKASAGSSIRFTSLFRNWAHQAITYMDRGEFFLRIAFELTEILIVFFVLNWLLGSIFLSVIISTLGVHTFNWITNGNIWALWIFSFPGLKNPGEEKTCAYLDVMTDRLKRCPAVAGVAIFGSVSRNAWHDKSDIDIRILRKPGALNLFRAFLYTMRERWLAMVHRQPMDLFLADSIAFLQRMRPDEKPVFLIKRDDRLEEAYPGISETILNQL